jgi:hypothetical protein
MDTQFLEIYRRNGQIYGTEIWSDTSRLRLEYERYFELQGKTASFVLVSRDHSIRREEAIAFAQAIAEKRFVHIHIDLSQMTVTRRKPE